MQDFKRLRVWNLAHELCLEVIEALPPGSSRAVPGLRRQAIRAATSVPANLAEGCARAGRQEFLHFVEIALASHNELDAHLRLARDARIIAPSRYSELRNRVETQRRMMIALHRTLQRRVAEEENEQRARTLKARV